MSKSKRTGAKRFTKEQKYMIGYRKKFLGADNVSFDTYMRDSRVSERLQVGYDMNNYNDNDYEDGLNGIIL